MTMWRHWMVGQVDASIAALVLLAIALVLRQRLSPAIRSALLLIALVRLALPPLVRSPWSEALVDLPPVDDTRMQMSEWLSADISFLLAGLTLVTVALVARLVLQARSIGLAPVVAAPPELQAHVDRLSNGMPIALRLSANDEGPFAAGVFRKIIVLPAGLVEQLDAEAMTAVLAHEVAHHARRDLWWLTAVAVLKTVVWFNPLAHVIARALVATREDGSDDWAVTHTSRDPFTYARALLQSARMIAVPHPLTAAGAHPMGKRLRRLLNGRAHRDDRVGVAGIAMVLAAAIFCIPGAHMPQLSAADHPTVIIHRVVRDAAITDIK